MLDRKARKDAVILSLMFHSILIVFALFYTLPALKLKEDDNKSLFHVKISRKKDLSSTRAAKDQRVVEPVRVGAAAKPQIVKPDLAENIEPRERYQPPAIQFNQPLATRKADPDFEIVNILKDDMIIQSREQREAKEEMIAEGDLSAQAVVENPITDEDIKISTEFVEKMPGITPAAVANEIYPLSRPPQENAELKERFVPVLVRQKDVESLDSDLLWNLSVYQDPRDGQKYFKITIKASDEVSKLPNIPKEILFLIDCSISIEQKRLEQFKEGVRYALTNLNEGDVFNIIAFKEDLARFRPRSVARGQDVAEQAVNFINNLRASQKTDTYSALQKTIEEEKSLTPSYIILLSDGLPTEGVTDSQEVIYKIAQLNEGRTAIFAFSGGVNINRYLLDFISFKNRGWSEYAERTVQISGKLSRFYDKIRNPVILNLHYLTTGVSTADMFPKILPDFFRNAEFTLYGLYDDETAFALQLLGDVQDKPKEFFVEGSFDKAQNGDETIARNWAFNKIYHLISLLEYDKENRELINEINRLSKKFDIRTPYRHYIGK